MASEQSAQPVVLIANPNREILRSLGNALHERGYDVRAARDGSKALEKAILAHPRAILFDEDCPLIAAKKFIQILRSNPRTEDIPVILMVGEDSDTAGLGYREAFIRKPFNNDELLALVNTSLRKMATAEQVRGEEREIEGSLGQISLFDLLQIFHMNMKTGRLDVESPAGQARIFIRQGRVVHASLGRHLGEKALFRVVGWKEGNFAFVPEQTTEDANIRRSTEALLLEAARQADEMEQLRRELPAANVRLAAVADIKERYEGLHPVTKQIVDLLEFYDTVGGLVEHTRVSDFEACRALRTLLDKGVLRVVGRDLAPEQGQPLLDHEMLYELKVKIAASTPIPERRVRARVVIVCPGEERRRELLSAMGKVTGIELQSEIEVAGTGLGSAARLAPSDNFQLDFVFLPEHDWLRPLWPVLGLQAIAGLVVSAGGAGGEYRANLAAQALQQRLRVPVQLLPAPPENSGDRVRLLVEAFREALTRLLEQASGRDRGVSVA